MKRFILFVTFIAIFIIGQVLAGNIESVSPGQKVEDFTLPDVSGKKHSLSDYKDAKAIALLFIATQCPVSNAYNERMAQLYEEYKDKDIVFIGINSNKQESVEEIIQHAQKNKLEFTILKDKNNVIADRFGATVTPEVFVLNPEFEVLYHGRIDDSQRESGIKNRDFRKALNQILAGEELTVQETKAFGCTIKRVSE